MGKSLFQLKVPTIAVPEGQALGWGFEIALTCDLRVTTADTKFGFPNG